MGKFSSIFRSKSDKDKPNETPVNPYAQQPPSSDTYSSAPAYGGNRGVPSGLPSGPRPGGYGGGLPSGPRPGSSAPPPYSAQNDAAFTDNKKRYDSAASSPSIGYGNDRPGAPSGYGGNRYDNAAGYGQNNNVQAPPPRQGGYGGLSEPNPLFDGRQQRDPYSAMAPPPRPEIPDNYENMTAEEKDDYEAETKKGEIIHTIQETAQSSARARLKAAEGVERMVGMHQMYDRDEAILNKVEQQLDESKHQARLAHAHLDNLDAANSSLFNLAANSKGKLAERSARKAQSEREREIDRDALREEQALRKRELEAATAQVGRPTLGFNKADRSKWAFEDNDGEQEELNNQIDDDMTEIALSVSTMNMLAKGFSVRTDAQINQVTRLTVKSDAAKDKVRAQNNRMKAEYSP
ncbi:uncharacterized protein PODANS_1_11410 [Podospora anserina S mat+]|uniref:Podospora anserina S mat+ genomic DNA chromosome 1, supercontig 2 n=1 Tax=Podospora anserina (strain S / ATCC MYA-4624 / DSM 980 / FGSC 10383) TaxID=515849 RepID=B2AYK5_PODAN|nr:uncharacterized protein PODANS_1_11410 [Podospora anserina S mat+]CAP69479.1 unnamed protein product [Podospora anserina S mat+]CDP23499.1 Putative protein of unknown function [Podospora anserina S mat+]